MGFSVIDSQMKFKKQVFVFGSGSAAYRPAAYLQFLYDRPDDFAVISMSGDSFIKIWKPLGVILRILIGSLAVVGSDVILIQPINHNSPYARLFVKIANWFRKRVVVDFYISHYETRVIDRKLITKDTDLAIKLKTVDIEAIKNSNTVIFLNQAESEYYQKVLELDLPSEKVEIIPLVVPDRKKAIMPYANRESEYLTVAWWGREGNPLHGFDVIAGAIRLLLAQSKIIRFAIFPAGGPDFTMFREQFRDIFDHPQVLMSLDYSFNNGRLLDYCIKTVDVAFGTFGATAKAKTVLTNKILDAASMGIPCVTQKSAGLIEFFKPGESVFTVQERPEDLANQIYELSLNKGLLTEVGLKAHEICKAHFSLNSHGKRLHALFP